MRKQLLFQLKSGLPWFCGGVLLAASLAFSFLKETPDCTIAVEKTNVFYMGVDNPICILVRGVPKEQIDIKTEGITLSPSGGDKYIVRAKAPGEATITVSGGDLKPTAFKFRIKRFPDPTMRIGTKSGGGMGAASICNMGGLRAEINDLGICADCETVSYDVIRYTKGQDPVTRANTGGRFSGGVVSLIQLAKPGDVYFFENIKVKCPGDVYARDMESMKITIE